MMVMMAMRMMMAEFLASSPSSARARHHLPRATSSCATSSSCAIAPSRYPSAALTSFLSACRHVLCRPLRTLLQPCSTCGGYLLRRPRACSARRRIAACATWTTPPPSHMWSSPRTRSRLSPPATRSRYVRLVICPCNDTAVRLTGRASSLAQTADLRLWNDLHSNDLSVGQVRVRACASVCERVRACASV